MRGRILLMLDAMVLRRLLAAVLVCSGCVAWATAARAQVCGDADGNGQITVTDGVQTLREAALLESNCTPQTCDLDNNGSITVTDGVNVLRLAAALEATTNCPGGGGASPQITAL
jgi:hypothetical protein